MESKLRGAMRSQSSASQSLQCSKKLENLLEDPWWVQLPAEPGSISASRPCCLCIGLPHPAQNPMAGEALG